MEVVIVAIQMKVQWCGMESNYQGRLSTMGWLDVE